MPHRFPLKEIALQAGVGTATVDRVLHGRGGVRPQTVDRVRRALDELAAQESQLSLSGRKLIVDLIVEAPQNFLNALADAVAAELPLLQPAVFRVRTDMRGHYPVDEVVRSLRRAGRLRTDGVILMIQDARPVRDAVRQLESDGIPVITLATDMPDSGRRAYVGLDNIRAGRTAAWFVLKRHDNAAPLRVLVTIRNDGFRGEGEREAGFREALLRQRPDAAIEVLVEREDRASFARRVAATAAAGPPPAALYSIGGGNRRIIDALDAARVPVPLYIAHDLDADNRALLAAGRIDVLLYHDLAEDIRNACRVIMAVSSNGRLPLPADGAVLRMMVPPMIGG